MVIPELPYDDDDLSTLERGLRQYMITKIVREAVPRPNSDAKNDARMIELKEYATFMEKKSFEKVQTKDEYYAELARIILSMQKHLQSRPKGSYEDREFECEYLLAGLEKQTSVDSSPYNLITLIICFIDMCGSEN